MQLSMRQWILGAGIIIACILLLGGAKLYQDGYRFSFSHGITFPSKIQFLHYSSEWQVYVDEKLLDNQAATEGATIETVAAAGMHDVVVTRGDKYFPWAKQIEVQGGQPLVLTPFHLPMSTNGTVIKKTDAEYATGMAAITAMHIPTSEEPLVSKDGVVEIFVRKTDTELGAELVARVKEGEEIPQSFCNDTCKREKVVTALSAEVRGVAFFPDRDDVIMIAVQDGVFAIEIDNRGNHQNFQILYRGIRPRFALAEDGTFYVQDAESLFRVFPYPAAQ